MSISGGSLRPFLLHFVSVGQSVFVHDRQLAVHLPPVPDRHTPFLRGFEGGQVQSLQKGLITREDAPLAVQFAVCGVQALDRVRCVDNGPYISRKLEDRGDDVPP